MKITKLLALTAALAVVGVAQADDMHWTPLFGGDTTLENGNSWYNANLASLGATPLATDNVFINRYGLNDSANDAGTTPATLNSALTADLMIIAWQNPAGGFTQSGHLDMGTGAILTLNNLQMGNALNTTVTLNLSGDASLTAGGVWMGTDATATSTVTMSGTSSFAVTAGLVNWNAGSTVVMDGGSVLTIIGGSTDWATDGKISALGAGDSIQAVGIAGGFTEYTVIPEPATLGMVAMLGGGILFIRRKFMI